MSHKKIKNISLSERVTKSLNHSSSESEYDSDSESAPKIVRFDDEDYDPESAKHNKSLSQIRKQNVQLLSEQSVKYSGEIAYRKSFDNSDANSTADSYEVTGEIEVDFVNPLQQQDENTSCDDGDSYDSEDSGNEQHLENVVSDKNCESEIEKGLCVQNQLAVWEKLLEIRIHSQKILSKANNLPSPNDFNKLSLAKEYSDAAREAKISTEVLLEKLIQTQVNLANQFSEIKNLEICARNKSPAQRNQSIGDSSKRFGQVIQTNFEKFRPYRNSVLLKWDDRTRLLMPSASSKRKRLTEEFDIIKKIDNVLTKKDDNIAKSQTLRGSSIDVHKNVEGTKEVSSPNIYDDTDFYHSQLRELIEFKSNESSNAYDVTKQFTELQKLRQKMKKKVDTRASKGRKIRYAIHHKLVNFTAPNNTTEWTEESRNELYRSLFLT